MCIDVPQTLGSNASGILSPLDGANETEEGTERQESLGPLAPRVGTGNYRDEKFSIFWI